MKKKIKCENNVLNFDSPIGLIEIQSKDDRIINVKFVDSERYDENLDKLLLEAKEQFKEYFQGKREKFDLPVKLNGTEFQKRVWTELKEIPYGKTASYKEVAIGIGNEKASRAVGNANNKNNIVIIIPCHRVIGSSGKLVGYAGGIWRKKWLLEHEKKFSG